MRQATLNCDTPLRSLIVPLTLAVATVCVEQACAQATFPAPLPGQAEAPTNTVPVPHVDAASPPAFQSGIGTDACMSGFLPLREEAEKRSGLIKAASERRAPSDEACKLIGGFSQAEIKMIRYIQANAARCGIPRQTAEQFKNSHRNTEKLQKQVCTLAQRSPSAGPGKLLGPGDFWIGRRSL